MADQLQELLNHPSLDYLDEGPQTLEELMSTMVDAEHMPFLEMQWNFMEYPLRLIIIGLIEATKYLDVYNELFGSDYDPDTPNAFPLVQ